MTDLSHYNARISFENVREGGTVTVSGDTTVRNFVAYNASYTTPYVRLMADGTEVECTYEDFGAGSYYCAYLMKHSAYQLAKITMKADVYACDGTVLGSTMMTLNFSKCVLNMCLCFTGLSIENNGKMRFFNTLDCVKIVFCFVLPTHLKKLWLKSNMP